MTTFLLIRDAHTDWVGKTLAGHLPGVSISARGREQAEALVGRLSSYRIDAIYSGPLQRTQETAEPLSRSRHLAVRIGLRLIEVDFGDWTGQSLADLEHDPLWKRFNELRSLTRAPGGEMMLEVQARMIDELEDLRHAHPDQTVAIFSHQDTIKAAVAHCLGVPLEYFLRFHIDPASVTILEMADWGPQILTLNHGGVL
ncbi:MAG: histidine phosphatase family protein [Bryobacteraceae bacterium]|nr:histidine phosphatase family protein [Bryobacteraceae bacterium]